VPSGTGKDRTSFVAIYHLSAKTIGRTAGQSAVAAAAYRSAERLTDRATGEVKWYSARAARVVFSGLFAPHDAPAWARNREALWNQVEAVEKRRNSTFCREYEISLPTELSHVQQVWLLQDFVKAAFVRKGFVVDACMHAPDRGADERNNHFHLMVAERQIDSTGFAKKKDRTLQTRELLRALRKQWADLANRHLERYGHAARIDHRSLAEQGVARLPTVHLGYAANEMERHGIKSRRGDRLRSIKAKNALFDIKGGRRGQPIGHEPKRIAEANRRTGGSAEGTKRGSRPSGDDGQFVGGVGGSGRISDRNDGIASVRRSQFDKRHYRARLRFALLRSMPIIARAQQTAEQVAEVHRIRNVDFTDQQDIWGVGQLPPAPR
jgi:hypothetical protein